MAASILYELSFHNMAQHHGTRHNDIQHNGIHRNNTQQSVLLCWVLDFVIVMLSVDMLGVIKPMYQAVTKVTTHKIFLHIRVSQHSVWWHAA